MILVDTSVWVDFFRAKNTKTTAQLASLIDQDEVVLSAISRLELLLGVRQSERRRLNKVLSSLQTFYPDLKTWQLLEGWLESAQLKGFGVADLLIAATATQHHVAVWSLDSDFRRLEEWGVLTCFRAEPEG